MEGVGGPLRPTRRRKKTARVRLLVAEALRQIAQPTTSESLVLILHHFDRNLGLNTARLGQILKGSKWIIISSVNPTHYVLLEGAPIEQMRPQLRKRLIESTRLIHPPTGDARIIDD